MIYILFEHDTELLLLMMSLTKSFIQTRIQPQSVAQSADNAHTKQKMMEAGKQTTEAYQNLLEHVNLIIQRPSTTKNTLIVLSQQVAKGVNKIVQASETIKGMYPLPPTP